MMANNSKLADENSKIKNENKILKRSLQEYDDENKEIKQKLRKKTEKLQILQNAYRPFAKAARQAFENDSSQTDDEDLSKRKKKRLLWLDEKVIKTQTVVFGQIH